MCSSGGISNFLFFNGMEQNIHRAHQSFDMQAQIRQTLLRRNTVTWSRVLKLQSNSIVASVAKQVVALKSSHNKHFLFHWDTAPKLFVFLSVGQDDRRYKPFLWKSNLINIVICSSGFLFDTTILFNCWRTITITLSIDQETRHKLCSAVVTRLETTVWRKGGETTTYPTPDMWPLKVG